MSESAEVKLGMSSAAGLLGQVLGSAQLAHASAEARFKCYLFRKSAMSQRLILRGLRSAALSHAEMGEAADAYKASFAAAPKDQQVCRYSPCIP